jgi:hypothetical protein
MELKTKEGQVLITLQIHRKETGKTEELQLIGTIEEGVDDGGNTQHSSTQCGD